MSRRIPSKAGALALPLAALSALLVRCSGTEADNPVADLVVTQCKTESEYDPNQVDEFLNGSSELQTAGGLLKGTEPPGLLRQALTPTADIPLGLYCVEWQLTENRLELQVVNFDSSCGAEWQGRTRLEGERVTIELENALCAVAGCGSCIFDTATVVELPSVADLTLALSLDPFCDGAPEVREWTLPLATEPRGISCDYGRPPGLGLMGPEFMWCGAGANGACDTGLSCIDQGQTSSRCLRPCSSDADCPLPGGTRCADGFCRPASSVATSG
jgi:hypothetical protein